MENCKDCLYYEICNDLWLGTGDMPNLCSDEFTCEHFKVKNRFIEIPCNVGDTVYEVQPNENIYKKWYVYGFVKYDGQNWAVKAKNNKNKYKYIDRTFDFSEFGKTVFLTVPQAAKQSLMEYGKQVVKEYEKNV